MMSKVIHVLPKYNHLLDMYKGWRACISNVPGCVVIHQDATIAQELVQAAYGALFGNESEIINGN